MATTQQIQPEQYDPSRLLAVLAAYKNGDFSQRMPGDLTGLSGKIADTLNGIIDMATDTTTEFERVSQFVGKQGKVGERIELPMMRGSWQKLVDAGNALTNDLASPMNEMIRVIGAVSEGDLSQQVPMEIDGLKLQGQRLRGSAGLRRASRDQDRAPDAARPGDPGFDDARRQRFRRGGGAASAARHGARAGRDPYRQNRYERGPPAAQRLCGKGDREGAVRSRRVLAGSAAGAGEA